MFNVGGPEILVIILVALVVLGPQQLPKAMRTFGNVMAEVKKVSSGFQAEMKSAMDTFTADEQAKAEPPRPAEPTAPVESTPAPASLALVPEDPAPSADVALVDRAAG